jgi:hypothetical protein
MNMQFLESRRDVSGGYKVDVKRGERIGRVSSEWFSRPDDEWTCNGLVPVTCLSLCHPGLESQGAYAAQI